MSAGFVTLHPEVAAALAAGRAVVALETTIVTHGMPWPRNVETARAVEAEVRAAGAVPATIAVMEGRIRVGLAAAELERLAQLPDVMKLSRADLGFALAAGRPGATTVAATMICARLAGIRIFATGGIGGVHRGVEATMDVSADIEELGRTPVAVVSAGAKAILDLPRTLELLETKGVPVIGYRTQELPAFWSRQSGLAVPLTLDSPQAIARCLKAQDTLGLGMGSVIANPIAPEHEIPAAEMAAHIAAALERAAAEGVTAKEVTPFLLAEVLRLTEGRSLEANIALVRANARLAGEIAVAYAAP